MRIIPRQAQTVILTLWCAAWVCGCSLTAEKNVSTRQFQHSGVTITFDQCKNVARDIHCLLIISTDNQESLVDIGGKASLTDNNDNRYPVNTTKIDDNALNIDPNRVNRIKIIAARNIHYRLIFHNIADHSAQIHTLELTFEVQSPTRSGSQFVSFQNIVI